MTKIYWPAALVVTAIIVAVSFAYYVHHNCAHPM